MPQTHVHEIVYLITASGERYSRSSLEQAIIGAFGEEMRFHSCASDDMSAAEAVTFLELREKFIPTEDEA